MMIDQAVRTGQPQTLTSFLSPVGMLKNLWSHRELAWQLARRDVEGRYRTAHLGLLWSIITPLILLVVYTFIFAVVFEARWQGRPAQGKAEYALTLFCGLLLYGLFAEVANRAPVMVVGNPNYVKRVVFPLEVFVVSGLLSAMFNMAIGYAVWVVGWVVFMQALPPLTILWLPVVVLPVVLTTAGVAWLIASLGVFIRDIGHAVVIAVQVLFFMSPVFYSVDQLPERCRPYISISPLARAIEDVRRVMMWGEAPEWGWWLGSTAAGMVVAVLGYAFFMKSKRAFADVL